MYSSITPSFGFPEAMISLLSASILLCLIEGEDLIQSFPDDGFGGHAQIAHDRAVDAADPPLRVKIPDPRRYRIEYGPVFLPLYPEPFLLLCALDFR